MWRQNFTYDRYGNRRIDEATTTAGMVGLNPQISTATNRINEAGYTYDAVGNLTRDELDHTYQYDAESRLISFSAATTATYAYDGAGQRVKKVVGTGSLAVTTTFVYDASGTLVAEYATNTGGSATGTSYVTMDRLGSTRLLTQGVIPRGGQAAKARYDYLPFGEEISTSYGNRTAAPGYNVEGIRQKYTGYERDVESGLDFAQARYYANAQGRFISADSVAGSATSPQTLNKYAYTGNNPLNNIDPSGHVYFGAQFNSSHSYGNEASGTDPDAGENGFGVPENALWKYLGFIEMRAADANRAAASAINSSATLTHEQAHTNAMNEQQASTAPQDSFFETAYVGCLSDLGGVTAPGMFQASDIVQVANGTGVDRTLLTITWYEESRFDYMPHNGIHDPNNIIGDIGPGQLFPGTWDKRSDGLKNPFGTQREVGQTFNGNATENLVLTGRALNEPFGPVRGDKRAEAAGIYKAGSKRGPGYQDRVNNFNKVVKNYDNFWMCMARRGY